MAVKKAEPNPIQGGVFTDGYKRVIQANFCVYPGRENGRIEFGVWADKASFDAGMQMVRSFGVAVERSERLYSQNEKGEYLDSGGDVLADQSDEAARVVIVPSMIDLFAKVGSDVSTTFNDLKSLIYAELANHPELKGGVEV